MAPQQIIDLVEAIMPRLLAAGHPTITQLRSQYAQASIARVDMTGAGVFVYFDLPQDVPLTEPKRFVGGNAKIVITGLKYPAGCVLFVGDGKLTMLELYCFEESWPNDFRLISIDNISPLRVPD